MIAIFDLEYSERASNLKKRLFTEGIPCAVALKSDLMKCRPINVIITYYDAFENLRNRPFDDIFAIVIGNGFVNSALNAKSVSDESAAISMAKSFLLKKYGVEDRQCLPFGIISNRGVFFAKKHFEIFGNIVKPTVSEYMIFKYLYAFADTAYCFGCENIRRFCYVRNTTASGNIEGNIAAHISNLNSKLSACYGNHLIRPKRSKGYYFDLTKL